MPCKLANLPVDDEEVGQDEEQAVAEVRSRLRHNQPIPPEAVLAEFGLSLADFERMGQTPMPRRVRHQSAPRTRKPLRNRSAVKANSP